MATPWVAAEEETSAKGESTPQHKAEWLKRVLEKRYEIKTQVIGGEADLEKDLRDGRSQS